MKITDSQKLYSGFRNYVNQGELSDYDEEYFSLKRHSHKYIDINKKLKDLNDQPKLLLIAFFVNEYCPKFSDLNKTLQEAKRTPRHKDREFLFKDNDF